MLLILLLIFLIESTHSISFDSRNITNTIDALELSATFYKDNFEKVNMDSIFGLRSSEGTLKDLLEKLEGGRTTRFVKRVTKIHHDIQKISEDAYLVLIDSDNAYNTDFEYLTSRPWFYQQAVRNTSHLISKASDLTDRLGEGESDQCMKSLIGTNVPGQKVCSIPDLCVRMMGRNKTSGYYITHQALFFILAHKLGCHAAIRGRFNVGIKERLYYLGANIHHQRLKLVNNDEQKDLLLEQTMICWWTGVQDCQMPMVLRRVLEWQDESGCIKDATPEGETDQQSKAERFIEEQDNFKTRHLNAEILLDDGCSSHTTGLYIAVLAAYTHQLLLLQPSTPRNVVFWDYMLIVFPALCITILLIFKLYKRRKQTNNLDSDEKFKFQKRFNKIV